MKVLVCALAVMVISVQADPSSSSLRDLIRRSREKSTECMKELNLDSKAAQLPQNSVCINVCEQEKIGLMVKGKYHIHRYLKGYTKRFPNASKERVNTMIHCLREANKITEKCEVGKSLQACIMKNFIFLFIWTKEKQ